MSDITWHTETRIVKELKPHKSNPRLMTKEQAEQLQKSIEKFNYVEPVVIQPDGRIIAGHMRVRIFKKLRRQNEEIEVRVPNRFLTDEEMKEYMIRSNKNTGIWDTSMLANEFDYEKLIDWGFKIEELTGEIEENQTTKDKISQEKEKCNICGSIIKKRKNEGD